MESQRRHIWAAVLIFAAAAAAATQCTPSRPASRQAGGGAVQSDLAVAAQKTYVAPGDLDQYYMFSSGGHSGQIYVFGIPSMRHLSTIPVFSPYPATGYGFDDDSRKMLGDLSWGDAHHPALSSRPSRFSDRWPTCTATTRPRS
jgi:nitrous-oxide reductase